MDEAKRERLEAAGWRVGDFADFLGLPDEDRKLIELRVDLGISTRKLRESRVLTQKALAKVIGSTQSRVAKIEGADPEVSLDLMFRAYFALGGRMEDLKVGPAPAAKPKAALVVEVKGTVPVKRTAKKQGA